MFNLKEFIVTNIVNGVKNKTFTKEYGNIMAVNYLVKGLLTEENVIDIANQVTESTEENVEDVVEVEEVTETEDPIEENIEETEDPESVTE